MKPNAKSFQIFQFNVNEWSDANFCSSFSLIQENELKRILKYKQVVDQKRSISSQVMLKSFFSKYFLDVDLMYLNEYSKEQRQKIFDNLNIERTRFCRPYLANYPTFNFNISHSGEYSILGVSLEPNQYIGIDIQKIGTKKDCLLVHNDENYDSMTLEEKVDYLKKMSQRYFTNSEFYNICLHNPDCCSKTQFDEFMKNYITEEEFSQILDRFFLFWTIKESFIKCIGMGLNFNLRRVEIEFEGLNVFGEDWNGSRNIYEMKPKIKIDQRVRKEYRFEINRISKDYVSSVCLLSLPKNNEDKAERLTRYFEKEFKENCCSFSECNDLFLEFNTKVEETVRDVGNNPLRV